MRGAAGLVSPTREPCVLSRTHPLVLVHALEGVLGQRVVPVAQPGHHGTEELWGQAGQSRGAWGITHPWPCCRVLIPEPTSSFFCSSVFSSRYTDAGTNFRAGASFGASLTVTAGGLYPIDKAPQASLRAGGPCPAPAPTWHHVSGAEAGAALLPILPVQPGCGPQRRLPPHTGGWVEIILEILLLRGQGALRGVLSLLSPSQNTASPLCHLP